MLYSLANDALGFYFQRVIHFENFFILFAIFTVAEFSFFCCFYFYILPHNLIRRSVFYIWLVFFLFATTDFFLINNMDAFDSIAAGVESILIILMCIYYLFIQIRGANNSLIYSTTNFWIIITFLIYMAGTFFLYIMAENMLQNRAFQIQYLVINAAFNILKNVLFSVSMLMKSAHVSTQLVKNNGRDDLLSLKLKN